MLSVIIAISSMLAQGKEPSKQEINEVLWVIDGVPEDIIIPEPFDSIEGNISFYLQRYYPIIQKCCIKEIQQTIMHPFCYGTITRIFCIKTRKACWIHDLELNGIFTAKRKRIPLGDFLNEVFLRKSIEKYWKIKQDQITSIQIHPEGKTVLDKKGKPHQVYISIETE